MWSCSVFTVLREYMYTHTHTGHLTLRNIISMNILSTVKLVHVHKKYPRDKQNVVIIHRKSLYTGLITWKMWKLPVTHGPYKQVVFIYRWSLRRFHCIKKLQNVFNRFSREITIRSSGWSKCVSHDFSTCRIFTVPKLGSILLRHLLPRPQ